VISTRILPVWNGSNFVDQPTRNPLWAFLDAAINTDYGAKRPVNKVDFSGIVSLAASADARGDTFDFEFRSPDQVPNAFDTILKSTRARHRWSGDLLSAVRDEARSIPQLLLTDREIVRGSLSVNWALNSADQADAVLLEYLDQDTWGPAEIQYPPNDGLFTATNPARIRLDGVISRARAQQEAAFFYRQALYRRTNITLDTEWEGKMLSYGSFVRVQSELPQSWGHSGRVVDYSGGVLTLDPPPTWSDPQHYVEIRTRRGRAFGPVQVSRVESDEFALVHPTDLAVVEAVQGTTIAAALVRDDDEEEVSFVIGTATRTAKDCIILQGRPSGDRVTLMMAVDDTRVHDNDLADPPTIPLAPALRDRASGSSYLAASFTAKW
jgi:Putative phage tail protein